MPAADCAVNKLVGADKFIPVVTVGVVDASVKTAATFEVKSKVVEDSFIGITVADFINTFESFNFHSASLIIVIRTAEEKIIVNKEVIVVDADFAESPVKVFIEQVVANIINCLRIRSKHREDCFL